MAEKLETRVLVPPYVKLKEWSGRIGDYCPWVICHEDMDMLDNAVLDAFYEIWSDTNDADDFSNFVTYLEDKGYTAMYTNTEGVWSPREKK